MALMMMMIEEAAARFSRFSRQRETLLGVRSLLPAHGRVVVGRKTHTVYVVIEYSFVEI